MAVTEGPVKVTVLAADMSDLSAALQGGWHDFRRAPGYGLAFALIYVVGGWLIWGALRLHGQFWWTIPATAGFPILGPFIACGFYEISRRIEAGEVLTPAAVFGVILRQKDRQIPSMAAVIVIFFLFWNFLSHMVFALFLGTATLTSVTSSLAVFATPAGMAMLVVGTAVGAVFSVVLFAISVVSLPLLLDREVDFVTAMITSVRTVTAAPVVMLGWGALIAVAMFVAMLPGFLGLFVVLPLFGHASWHLYRRIIA